MLIDTHHVGRLQQLSHLPFVSNAEVDALALGVRRGCELKTWVNLY